MLLVSVCVLFDKDAVVGQTTGLVFIRCTLALTITKTCTGDRHLAQPLRYTTLPGTSRGEEGFCEEGKEAPGRRPVSLSHLDEKSRAKG